VVGADLPSTGAQVEIAQEPEAAELGYAVILSPDVWLGDSWFPCQFAIAIRKVFYTAFAFVPGGVVHEKGLLPQACEYSLMLADFGLCLVNQTVKIWHFIALLRWPL
jgi:hypothetical protein